MKVGVLALQGDFREHLQALERLGVSGREVRNPGDLEGIERLIIPGGESTTISLLMRNNGLAQPIAGLGREGLPIFGTCAGLIVLAGELIAPGASEKPLGLTDITIRRNAYGRQVESFEEELEIKGIGKFPGVFIRAPQIVRVGPRVEVLASQGETTVMAREGKILVTSFHPELTGDDRVHRLFQEL
jgi:5'-phosphate synthase pdxT subunit